MVQAPLKFYWDHIIIIEEFPYPRSRYFVHVSLRSVYHYDIVIGSSRGWLLLECLVLYFVMGFGSQQISGIYRDLPRHQLNKTKHWTDKIEKGAWSGIAFSGRT